MLRSHLWSALSLLLFLFDPILPFIRAVTEVVVFAWDIAFRPDAARSRLPTIAPVDVGPLQRIRARAFLHRRAARIADFRPAGCPVLIAA